MLKWAKALPGLVWLTAVLAAGSVQATELVLSGIVGERAVLVVDNGPAQLLAVGRSTPEGVRLLSLEGDVAVVEFEGRRQTLRLWNRVVQPGKAGKTDKAGNAGAGTLTSEQARKILARGVELTLVSDASGHFMSDGEINGGRVNFLVDTGATTVAIGQLTAQGLRLDLDDGQMSQAETAGGVVNIWRVTLRSLKIGGLRFDNIDAVVVQADMPHVLLGMNVLGQMEMRRDGRLMRLKKKL